MSPVSYASDHQYLDHYARQYRGQPATRCDIRDFYSRDIAESDITTLGEALRLEISHRRVRYLRSLRYLRG